MMIFLVTMLVIRIYWNNTIILEVDQYTGMNVIERTIYHLVYILEIIWLVTLILLKKAISRKAAARGVVPHAVLTIFFSKHLWQYRGKCAIIIAESDYSKW